MDDKIGSRDYIAMWLHCCRVDLIAMIWLIAVAGSRDCIAVLPVGPPNEYSFLSSCSLFEIIPLPTVPWQSTHINGNLFGSWTRKLASWTRKFAILRRIIMLIPLYFAILSGLIVIPSVPVYIIMLYSHFKYRKSFPFSSTFFKLSLNLGIFDLMHVFNDWVIGVLHYVGLYDIIVANDAVFAKQFNLLWWYSAWGQKFGVLCLAIDRLACMWLGYVSALKSWCILFCQVLNLRIGHLFKLKSWSVWTGWSQLFSFFLRHSSNTDITHSTRVKRCCFTGKVQANRYMSENSIRIVDSYAIEWVL